MPRANRFFLPGTVWHITHRCHDRRFLLKFEKDRKRWRYWLFQARRRFGVSILNYIATSNHVHILIWVKQCRAVSMCMQLVAGRTAQEFNRRKSRKGAFWEDRFFATAVGTDAHLARCLVYIDLNMVRAGVVTHPGEWQVSGYNEIQNPPKRYRIIDQGAVCQLFQCKNWVEFQARHRAWVASKLEQSEHRREAIWTEPVAVGPDPFIAEIRRKLGVAGYSRSQEALSPGCSVLREPDH